MFTKLKSWPTRTRIKVFVICQIPVFAIAGIILWGWFNRLPDAPGMMTAVMGSNGLWGIGTALSIGLENFAFKKEKAKESG